MDDFSVKFVGKEHVEHLLKALKKDYKLVVDWDGDLYCGIKLDWTYEEGYLDILMPGYIEKLLQRMKHEKPTKLQHSPYQAPPRIFGTRDQNTVPPDASPKLEDKRKQKVQQVIGSVLYYAHTVDISWYYRHWGLSRVSSPRQQE